jgi:hypothetical protein
VGKPRLITLQRKELKGNTPANNRHHQVVQPKIYAQVTAAPIRYCAERRIGFHTEEVTGSIPVSPTIY